MKSRLLILIYSLESFNWAGTMAFGRLNLTDYQCAHK